MSLVFIKVGPSKKGGHTKALWQPEYEHTDTNTHTHTHTHTCTCTTTATKVWYVQRQSSAPYIPTDGKTSTMVSRVFQRCWRRQWRRTWASCTWAPVTGYNTGNSSKVGRSPLPSWEMRKNTRNEGAECERTSDPQAKRFPQRRCR